MACKPTKCSVCGGTFPACQIKDGKCASCRAKEQAPAPESKPVTQK